MGNFRDKADTEHHTTNGEGEKYRYALSHICGKDIAHR